MYFISDVVPCQNKTLKFFNNFILTWNHTFIIIVFSSGIWSFRASPRIIRVSRGDADNRLSSHRAPFGEWNRLRCDIDALSLNDQTSKSDACLYETTLGLPPVQLLPERSVFWPLCPASRRNPGRCPVFTARRSYASAVLGVVILSVCLSVCLSQACSVTNPKNLLAIFLYRMKVQSF